MFTVLTSSIVVSLRGCHIKKTEREKERERRGGAGGQETHTQQGTQREEERGVCFDFFSIFAVIIDWFCQNAGSHWRNVTVDLLSDLHVLTTLG